jgi:ABC-type glycerol-3-phosphate transport system substrate-binding protein
MRKRSIQVICAALIMLIIATTSAIAITAWGPKDIIIPNNLKPVTITVGGTFPDLNKDAAGQYIQKLFNCKFVSIPYDSEKLRVMAVSGTLPDVFGTALGNPIFNQLKNTQAIKKIPDNVLANYPNLKHYVQTSDVAQAYHKMTRSYFSLPQLSNPDIINKAAPYVMYYRADWAKRLNIKAPTTTTELYAMMDAFTNKDPDGNGIPDTYGTSGNIWQIHYIPWEDEYNWVKNNGKWTPGYISSRMLPALQFWNKCYKNGILDPEFSTADPKPLFYKGKIGVLYWVGQEYWQQVVTQGVKANNPGMTDTTVMDAVKILAPLKVDASSPARSVANIQNNVICINAKISDDKFKRLLMFYEWTLSPKGKDFTVYGFKKIDYSVVKGKAVSKLPAGTQLFNKYSTLNLFSLVSWNFEPYTPPAVSVWPLAIHNWRIATDKIYDSKVYSINLMLQNIVTLDKSSLNYSEDLIDNETQFNAAIASSDPVKAFNNFKAKLMAKGLQKLIYAVNKDAKAQNIK